MGDEKREGMNPVPENLKNILNEAQLRTLDKMEGFGWKLDTVQGSTRTTVEPK